MEWVTCNCNYNVIKFYAIHGIQIHENHGIQLKLKDLNLRYKEILLTHGEVWKQRSKLGHTDLTVCVKMIPLELSNALNDLTGQSDYKLSSSSERLMELGDSNCYP